MKNSIFSRRNNKPEIISAYNRELNFASFIQHLQTLQVQIFSSVFIDTDINSKLKIKARVSFYLIMQLIT